MTLADDGALFEKDRATVLSRIDEIKSSKNFLDECTYFISLKGNDFHEADDVWIDLYEVKDTCAYHEGMYHCPVLVKMNVTDMQKRYNDAQYLIQVWKKGGTRAYLKGIKS